MWKIHHQNFEIKLWKEEDLDGINLTNKNVICDTSLNPALRADFLRLELLYLFGGIYADVDMTCERPLDPLLTLGSFITGIANTQAFEINNGLIITEKEHPLLAHLIQKISESFNNEQRLLINRIKSEN